MNAHKKRNAGILLSITSLPSPFGIGDMGPEAFSFSEFLYRCKQSFWQILPLTPVDEKQAYSPYSACSSFAGNVLLISPEKLVQQELLSTEDLIAARLPVTSNINYREAESVKNRLFEKAFKNFSSKEHKEFALFCKTEAHWLDDFALYVALKKHFDQQPWFEWPDQFKLRNRRALKKFRKDHVDEIKKYQWLQFIFFAQWRSLKDYCNKLNIRILGDLPFYTSYDSADVWSNPEIFKLNKDGSMAGIAGVPPDYFNADGQLWGMPVYRWDVLEKKKFSWWISRIKKNLELSDVLRLDHFRAFSSYWEVPAKSKTAKNGKWKSAPGQKLFTLLRKQFKSLPFVAEDLGDISADVYKLRDEFELPGMKVLQFAFGDNMQESDHIPHNYQQNFFAYTGTHDNNTTRGWYETEIKKSVKRQLEKYIGVVVTEKNVHRMMIRLIYSSVARTAIIPIQDILGLDENARMNRPASTDGNWLWRLKADQLSERPEKFLKQLIELYNR